MKKPSLVFLRKLQRIPRSRGPDFKSFDAQTRVVVGACWRGKIENVIYFSEIEGEADIVLLKFKTRL